MRDPFTRFASFAAIASGVLSIVYAVVFLFVSKTPDDPARAVSWLLLALGGALGGAVWVALYQRTRSASEGFALWGMLIGAASGGATMADGFYHALLVSRAPVALDTVTALPAGYQFLSQVDPAGLAAFGVFAIASFVFGWLILRSAALPRNLGYVAILNSILLILLLLGNIFQITPLILGPGGLTSVIVTPLWWIWLGRELPRTEGRMRMV